MWLLPICRPKLHGTSSPVAMMYSMSRDASMQRWTCRDKSIGVVTLASGTYFDWNLADRSAHNIGSKMMHKLEYFCTGEPSKQTLYNFFKEIRVTLCSELRLIRYFQTCTGEICELVR